MKKHKRISLIGRLGFGVSVGLLGVLVLALLLPVYNNAQAEGSVNAEQRVGLRAVSTISLSVESDSVNIEVLPTQAGQFGVNSTKVGVVTNSEAGYRVMMSTLSDNTSLVSTDASKVGEQYQVKSITGEATSADFGNNTWGYAATSEAIDANTVYKAIPTTSGTEIAGTTASTAGQRDIYNLAFGVKINNSLPAGNYYNKVLLSVVANAEAITSLDQVTYMQEITAEICANTANLTQRQLYDLRDGKRYWVERMADGHCWMIQNLALDLEAGHTFTSADTDLANTATKSWTVPEGRGTETEIPEAYDGTVDDVRSWNLGEYIIINPSTITGTCQAVLPGEDLAEKCQLYLNVEGWNPDGYAAQAVDARTYEPNSRTYDPRYLLGNYYQFGAATAGTGVGLQGDSASATEGSKLVNTAGSICPKGWKLPSSGQNNTTGAPFTGIPGSFYELFSNYGYGSMKYQFWQGHGHANLPEQGLRVNELVWYPLYLVRAGVILSSGGLSKLDSDVSLWTSTVAPSNTPNEFLLTMYSTSDIRLWSAYALEERGYGLSVRCVSAD